MGNGTGSCWTAAVWASAHRPGDMGHPRSGYQLNIMRHRADESGYHHRVPESRPIEHPMA
jgi:hypothetical protein